jgi:hypothetical protein
MHVHLSGAALILLIIAVVLFKVYGWAVLVWPAIVLVVAAAMVLAILFLRRRDERRLQRALALRRRIATLEAEQGIPLMTDGICPQCGQQLIAGARFCSYCKTPTDRVALACEKCGTRNAPDAVWCGACGAELPEPGELAGNGKGIGSRLVVSVLEWPYK